MLKGNILLDKSFKFSIRMVKLYNFLKNDSAVYILKKQLLRAGTSIGANCREACNSESKSDFIHKLGIGLKEATETEYWLDLMFEVKYLEKKMYESLKNDCIELIKLLTSSIKTAKKNLKDKK